MKKNILIILLMMAVVSIAGELKVYPFGSTFRISFGTPIFLLFLLLGRNLPMVSSGAAVGAAVVFFRIMLAWRTQSGFDMQSTLLVDIPAFFYYVTYSSLFRMLNMNRLYRRTLLLGGLCILIETASSFVELLYRYITLGDTVTLHILGTILIIAVIRSFFALSFFYIIKLREADLRSEQQQTQNRHMLLLISNLYEESIHLKKTLLHAENITRDCYAIYRNLKNPKEDEPVLSQQELAQRILGLAGQIHEIKKDNQKIYAGLSKMISDENPTDYMTVPEIGQIIVQTNRNYAALLKKQIKFELDIVGDMPPVHVFTMLSLINNLVSNAVEAIPDDGIIRIAVRVVNDQAELTVSDTGTGVITRNKELIFQPGYTSKYDSYGNPSTGIGLSYVREMVMNLDGTIELLDESVTEETVFVIKLPLAKLVEIGGVS